MATASLRNSMAIYPPPICRPSSAALRKSDAICSNTSIVAGRTPSIAAGGTIASWPGRCTTKPVKVQIVPLHRRAADAHHAGIDRGTCRSILMTCATDCRPRHSSDCSWPRPPRWVAGPGGDRTPQRDEPRPAVYRRHRFARSAGRGHARAQAATGIHARRPGRSRDQRSRSRPVARLI